MTFHVGQRWASQTEPELGLGLIVAIEQRQLVVVFPAANTERSYRPDNAPLTRVRFSCGETISSHEGWQMMVQTIQQQQGCLIYQGQCTTSGQQRSLNESMLDHHFVPTRPQERLFAGQFDAPHWFDLRRQGRGELARHQNSDCVGLAGARVELIPHQLHIAREVADRYAPRVLLSDEVGLGKTIEAALIIHRQLLTGRAQRILIVVPESLLHQWLVEMIRRINVSFALFDASRCQALSEPGTNPFDTEQCVLCSMEFLSQNPAYHAQACASHWDLAVVDEAHHLTWQEDEPSVEYRCIEPLANQARGLLLLTATPDQLGHASHFARLRLLDPQRFYDYDAFLAEEKTYQQLAQAITPVLMQQPLSPEQKQALITFAPELEALIESADQWHDHQRQQVIEAMIDRHGTGRVILRNSRQSISGFPQRHLYRYPLNAPESYAAIWQVTTALEQQLQPETHDSVKADWTAKDPRIDWLIQTVQQHRGHKILAICACNTTALSLAEVLRQRAGIHAGVFHQGQTLVERDRMANYFAAPEHGGDLLICSEIGSEGRNFQFAQHLVLFDLPLEPDLLEQRIGRLDRIGQQEAIYIHVPYFTDTAQQRLLQWYHQGLNAFEHTCATGSTLFERFATDLRAVLHTCADKPAFEHILQQTHEANEALKRQLEQGRDRLLELIAGGMGQVAPLVEALRAQDRDASLKAYMPGLLDSMGVDQEDLTPEIELLRPAESMLTPLPGLQQEGLRVTYDRSVALAREDTEFLSWDHPLVQHSIDWLCNDSLGNVSIALSHDPNKPNGTYYLQTLYVLEAQADQQLQLSRFLPGYPISLTQDASGQFINMDALALSPVSQDTGLKLLQALGSALKQGLQQSHVRAEQERQQRTDEGLTRMTDSLDEEIRRLQYLQQINPSIRQEEVQALQHQRQQLHRAIEKTNVRLDAIRLIINSH